MCQVLPQKSLSYRLQGGYSEHLPLSTSPFLKLFAQHCGQQHTGMGTSLVWSSWVSPKSLTLTRRGDLHGGSHQGSSSSCGRSVPHASLLHERKQIHATSASSKLRRVFHLARQGALSSTAYQLGFRAEKGYFFSAIIFFKGRGLPWYLVLDISLISPGLRRTWLLHFLQEKVAGRSFTRVLANCCLGARQPKP